MRIYHFSSILLSLFCYVYLNDLSLLSMSPFLSTPILSRMYHDNKKKFLFQPYQITIPKGFCYLPIFSETMRTLCGCFFLFMKTIQ